MRQNKPMKNLDDMGMMAGMMMSALKPMIKSYYGKPENDSVKEQVNILALAVMEMFPDIKNLLTEEDIKGLLYNAKQTELDDFYGLVLAAMAKRR